MMRNYLWLLLLPLTQAGAGPLALTTVAQTEEVIARADGTVETRLVDVTTVVPGDEVIYTITYQNTGDEAAEAVTITDPVPAQMRYLDGTAFAPGADITFSVDGGRSWGTPQELRILAADGSERRATAADYTHIRWRLRHAIGPGKRGYARFRAALR